MTIVDCGPMIYAIWRKLKHENSVCAIEMLEELFLERGPVSEELVYYASISDLTTSDLS